MIMKDLEPLNLRDHMLTMPSLPERFSGLTMPSVTTRAFGGGSNSNNNSAS